MLRELHISGLGVIEDIDLELDPGLNVLTGETGAGKTMVTVGLALALGQRASASLVRTGAKTARVQARFDAPDTSSAREWAEDGELVLARTIGADGKGSARICGQIATISALAGLAGDLVEVHGQYQTQRLLQPAAQTAFLDRFAGAEHLARLGAFRECHGELRGARARLVALEGGARERERELDLLAYQVREIESAGVAPGEMDALAAEESRLAHAERLLEAAAAAREGLSADGPAPDAVRAAAAALGEAAGLDAEAAELGSRARGLAEELAELARDVRGWQERVQLDPERLEDVRGRMHALRGLERKYGEGEEGILAFLEQARSRLGALSGSDDERRGLADRVDELAAETTRRAMGITATRSAAAPLLAEAVRTELRELGMDGAEVAVELVPEPDLGPSGAERAEFLLAGGTRQPSLPLAKIASGGELSRTMLACRTVLADLDAVPTLVFDEVDAGIGGRAGVAVGRRLAALAAGRQVLVVTHLPQIASFADRHVLVEKRGGAAALRALADGERVAELSRMLSGLPGSDAAALHAEELLSEAGRERPAR